MIEGGDRVAGDTATRERAPFWGGDWLSFGIAGAAILLLVVTAGTAVPRAIESFASGASAPDALLVNALLLNIALVLFVMHRYRAVALELSRSREDAARSNELARTDPLTGCLNRRALARPADRLIEAATQARRGVAFFMLDIDQFKLVNDRRGHSAGDALLRACAQRLVEIMPDDAIITRTGGDEFGAMLAYDPNDPETLYALARTVVEECGTPIEHDGCTLHCTVSVGFACDEAPRPAADTGERLMNRADIAMYHAKRAGRNRLARFEPTMELALQTRCELEDAMRSGVENDEFEPFYERQIDLATEALTGFEMLARWRSPRMGLILPETFIPLAEELGLIAPISERLMQRAFCEARHWDSRLSLSVNISPLQLRDPWFAKKVLKLLTQERAFRPNGSRSRSPKVACTIIWRRSVRTLIASLRNQGVTR